MSFPIKTQEVEINLGPIKLSGDLNIPEMASGVVLFAHGSGSGRLSPRNQRIAEKLNNQQIGTLLFDLLTLEEDKNYSNRFNIDLISKRLVAVTKWYLQNMGTTFPLGYFGASTGAASALKASVEMGKQIKAIVSRGGRPDLAFPQTTKVKAPTLLIVGSLDRPVIKLNRDAYSLIEAPKNMVIVEGASHLFEEEGKLDEVSELAGAWFRKYLPAKEENSLYNYI